MIVSGFQTDTVRRRATVLAVGGAAACLTSCAVLSTLSNDGISVPIRATAALLLVAGFGAGLGGILSLSVTSGARYAAGRLANLDDD